MKKFLFYDNVFNQEELDLTWEELNKTDWGLSLIHISEPTSPY